MQVRTSVSITLAVVFVLALPALSVAPVDQFLPKAGEPVKLWYHAIQAGHVDRARAFFLNVLIPRMKVDNATNDTYFRVNENINEILAVSFWGQGDVTVHPHADAVDERMKAHAAKLRRRVDYRLVLTSLAFPFLSSYR